jgi:hypothetical protein
MIEALMNGMTPREKMAQFESAPPLKRLKRAATPPEEAALACDKNQTRRTSALIPGVVIHDPARIITIATRVKRTLVRSSGILNIFAKALIISKKKPDD